MKTAADLIKRVDQLLEQGTTVLSQQYNMEHHTSPLVHENEFIGFRTAVLSFIERVYGTEHTHFLEFNKNVRSSYAFSIQSGIAILQVIKDELAGGWLFTIRGLLTAEVFSDFLEMADHFLENGFKDPAAVMAGSVLEEHLRQLCISNGILVEEETPDKTFPKKADRLNNDLAKADI